MRGKEAFFDSLSSFDPNLAVPPSVLYWCRTHLCFCLLHDGGDAERENSLLLRGGTLGRLANLLDLDRGQINGKL